MIVKLRVLKFLPLNSSINIHSISFFTKIRLILVLLLAITNNSFSQDYKEIKAKNGDGIYNILRENGIPLSYINEFKELNKSKLIRNSELKIGETYRLPIPNSSNSENSNKTAKTSTNKIIKRHDIFGKDYQDVEIVSNELDGAVYYLVSGHGGPDPGAVAKYKGKTLCEDEYAYDITLRLARNLISYGATVYMIIRDNNDGIRNGWYLNPDKDEKCYPNHTIPINQNARLRQRKDAVNLLYQKYKGSYQRLVVIHVDSRSQGEKIDVFFYHDKRSEAGKKLAYNLRNTFDHMYNKHQPGRGYHGTISDRNLFMLKYSWPVATFIELGNINHERDLKRFIMEDNRQALANWLTEGLQLDFKNNR